jgi:hypothetical protein
MKEINVNLNPFFKKLWNTIKLYTESLVEHINDFATDDHSMFVNFICIMGVGITVITVITGIALLCLWLPVIPIVLFMLFIIFVLGWIVISMINDFRNF